MSDNSEMVDAEETPLADVIDDSCTVQYIEITPLFRPSDDCYKSECIDPVVEVKPEDLQDVKQEPADEIDIEGPHYCIKVRFFWLETGKFFLILLIYTLCNSSMWCSSYTREN